MLTNLILKDLIISLLRGTSYFYLASPMHPDFNALATLSEIFGHKINKPKTFNGYDELDYSILNFLRLTEDLINKSGQAKYEKGESLLKKVFLITQELEDNYKQGLRQKHDANKTD
jgi:hypothetical protein